MSKFSNLKIDAGNLQVGEMCSAYLSIDQDDITSDIIVKVLLDAELYDPNSRFDTVNHKFTTAVAGYYLITGNLLWDTGSDGKSFGVYIRRNDSDTIAMSISHSGVAAYMNSTVSKVFKLEVDDYVELFAFHTVGTATPDLVSGAHQTYMTINLLSV